MDSSKLQEKIESFISTLYAEYQAISGPYGYEPITPPGEEIHWRIHDKDDNRVATCKDEERASLLVSLVNAGFRNKETVTSDAPQGLYAWYTITPTDGRSFCKIHDAKVAEVATCHEDEAHFITTLMNCGAAALIVS